MTCTFKKLFLCATLASTSCLAQRELWMQKFEATGPVDFAPLPTGAAEQKTNSDFVARIFKGPGDTHKLDIEVDVSKVNQAILPTDANGNLTAEAKSLNLRPYVRFYLTNGTEQIVDVRCTAKVCKASLQPFPYNPDAENQKLRVEVNIRGMQGKNWELDLTRFRPSLQNPSPVFPKQVDFFGPSTGLSVVRYHQKNSFTAKSGSTTQEPDFVDEWALVPINANTKQKSSVGPMFTQQQSKIELLQGELTAHYSIDKKTLIKERVVAPLVLWLEPGTYVRVENEGSIETKLRWIEFSELKKPAKSKRE